MEAHQHESPPPAPATASTAIARSLKRIFPDVDDIEIAEIAVTSPTPPPPPPSQHPPPPPVQTSAPAPATTTNPLLMSSNFSKEEMAVQQPGPPSAHILLKDDPVFSKYFKMLSMHLPKAAVVMKMTVEGVDPSMLELDPHDPSPNQPQSILSIPADESGQEVAAPSFPPPSPSQPPPSPPPPPPLPSSAPLF